MDSHFPELNDLGIGHVTNFKEASANNLDQRHVSGQVMLPLPPDIWAMASQVNARIEAFNHFHGHVGVGQT